ncbi:hypothetical protein SAMN04488128_1011781 [Chitinophaga eiseniae]|uniref:Uncharacterized protein n=1 Tax=Chitinophaga eiseniae TaxID=634771 RepID=A0A1T4NWJ4_9BACT|nr:hypothetical protein SAMN04488128_1011781 [Chitinophaga eiseniae]
MNRFCFILLFLDKGFVYEKEFAAYGILCHF